MLPPKRGSLYSDFIQKIMQGVDKGCCFPSHTTPSLQLFPPLLPPNCPLTLPPTYPSPEWNGRRGQSHSLCSTSEHSQVACAPGLDKWIPCSSGYVGPLACASSATLLGGWGKEVLRGMYPAPLSFCPPGREPHNFTDIKFTRICPYHPVAPPRRMKNEGENVIISTVP